MPQERLASFRMKKSARAFAFIIALALPIRCAWGVIVPAGRPPGPHNLLWKSAQLLCLPLLQRHESSHLGPCISCIRQRHIPRLGQFVDAPVQVTPHLCEGSDLLLQSITRLSDGTEPAPQLVT